MAMSESQQRALITLFFTQQTDYVLAIIDKVFGVKYGTVTLEAGVNTIVFSKPYEINTEYRFVEKTCHAIEGGFDLGKPDISNENENGFDVTVDEPATFTYITQSYKFWISDETANAELIDNSPSLSMLS